MANRFFSLSLEEATKPIPVTSFKCQDQGLPGYYGDVETACTVSEGGVLVFAWLLDRQY